VDKATTVSLKQHCNISKMINFKIDRGHVRSDFSAPCLGWSQGTIVHLRKQGIQERVIENVIAGQITKNKFWISKEVIQFELDATTPCLGITGD